MLITLALNVLLSAIKNPKKSAELKKSLLELRDAINTAFPGE